MLEVGLGLATIGMVTGIVVGTMLVNYAINSPSISVARQNPTVRRTKIWTSITICLVPTTHRWTSGGG